MSAEPWTVDRIREAFIYDGGESEYYDPINGTYNQRKIMGAIFDTWLAEHDAAIRAEQTKGNCPMCNGTGTALRVVEDHDLDMT